MAFHRVDQPLSHGPAEKGGLKFVGATQIGTFYMVTDMEILTRPRDNTRWLWLTAILVVILLGFLDYITGYLLSFFVFYFLPISGAAWFIGRGGAMCLAVLSVMVWLGADLLSGHVHGSAFYVVWNTAIRLASFFIIGYLVSLVRSLLDRQRELAEERQRLLSEVRVLEAFLPICCECKKIRNENGEWQQMESYIGVHTGTRFSHGYCPECARKAMAAAGIIDRLP